MAIVVAFGLLSLFFLSHGGVRLGGDSLGSIANARQLARGGPIPESPRTRLTYLALIAACEMTGLGLAGVVAVQLAAAAVAGIALWDLGRRLGGRWAGLAAAAFLVANPDIVRWHVYVLTDSLYTSAVVVSAWAVQAASERGRGWYLGATFLLLLAALLRPNGWLLLMIASCYWLSRSAAPRGLRWVGTGCILLGTVGGCFLLLTTHPGFLTDAPDVMLRRGEVVWGYPEGRLSMPADPDVKATGLPGALAYGLRHPLACGRQAAARVGTELRHTRAFYSAAHNMALNLLLPPLYSLATIGFVAFRGQTLAHLLAALVVGHLLVQGISFADWDGRFLLYVFPLIGVFSACGLVRLGRVLSPDRARQAANFNTLVKPRGH